MSDCTCAPRSRFMLWTAIYFLWIQSCSGCGARDMQQDGEIDRLRTKVEYLNLHCKTQ